MKPYKSGIRHDYKHATGDLLTDPHKRGWSWFVLGLSLPVVTVFLLLVSERNESKPTTPAPAEAAAADVAAPTEQARERVPVLLERAHEPVSLPLPSRGDTAALPVAEPEDDALATAGEVVTVSAEAPQPASFVEPAATPAAAQTPAPFVGPAAPPAGVPEPAPAPFVGPISAATLDLLVARGDTMEILFRRNGLSVTDLAAMAALPDAGDYLRRLRPGDEIFIAHDAGRVLALRRELNEIDMLSITRADSGFEVSMQKRAVDLRTVGAHGRIVSSLFEAGIDAGMSDAVTLSMAHDIFQWDIDFIQDVREGDTFTVVYEELWRDGVKLRDGEIVAAEFVNQGKSHRAARYLDASGRSDYYTPDGRSVRKAFLRAPVEFTRISSNFNPNRRHPVLNTIRAHRGVDYAAPSGTPVIAAGDGKVISRGVNGGYGNAVVLQHGGNVTTLYGHLSRFGKQRVGSRVEQGEVIGYVGKTGLATGPHLHYEYRIGGAHKNPRTVPLPPADPVGEEYRDDFHAATAPLWQELERYQQAYLAATAE